MTDIVSPAIARIRAQCATFSSRVAGAAELAAATEAGDNIAVPHAWVVYAGETAEPAQTAGQVFQAVELGFAVVVAIDNSADRRGAAATDSAFTIRESLLTALLGWEPVADVGLAGVEYRGSEFLEMTRARLWHQFNFTVIHNIQEA